MTEDLLILVLVIEFGTVGIGIAWLAGQVARTARRNRREAEGLRRARELTQLAAVEGSSTSAAVTAFRGLSVDNAVAVLLELSTTVSGAALPRLRYVADAGGMVSRAHAWSRSPRWWLRLRGVRLLGQLGITPTPPLRFFDDGHPGVKAAAADCVVAPVQAEVVTRMLAMLADRDAQCRFSAKAGLFRIGREAAGAVGDHLAADDAPALAAALDIAVALGDPAFLGPALRLSGTADPVVRRAATTLLARTGGDVAGPRLVQLLADPDAGVRVAAAEGAGELGHWPAAPVLAAALGDGHWAVRSAAAVALRRLGPPGTVYLRRAAGSRDAVGAEIARQVLAFPIGAMSVVGR